MLGGEEGEELFNHFIRIFKVIKKNHNFEIMHENLKCQKRMYYIALT